MIARLALASLNHVLMQNGWALERLSGFSGKTVRFDIPPFSMAFVVLPDGRVSQAERNVAPDVQCVIPPSLLPRLAIHDELAYRDIESTGDTALLAEILFLSRNLRWDAAEDLSALTGDIIAERIVQAAKSIEIGPSGLAQAVSEYLTEENPQLAKQNHIRAYAEEVDDLRDAVARLEARIRRLTGN